MDLTAAQKDKLRLCRTEGIGPIRYKEAIETYGNATNALKAIKTKKPHLYIPSDTNLNKEVKALKKLKGQFLFIDEDNYPEQLKLIADAPPVLCVLGDASILHQPQIAFVGSRNASAQGIKLCHKLSTDIVKKDTSFVITSGFARGIDTAAHKGATFGQGKTVAVLAGGVDVIYPPENEPLYKKMLSEGCCFVSEAPVGVEPLARHFPRRNRIISGLSQVIVVVEAMAKSGTMITAQTALEQGRELMAIPGHPADSRSFGPNKLIQQGAKLVQNAEDILEEIPLLEPLTVQEKANHNQQDLFLAPEIPAKTKALEPTLLIDTEASHIDQKLLSLISSTGTEIDDLITLSGLPEAEVNAWIVEQELMDRVERQSGSKIALKA